MQDHRFYQNIDRQEETQQTMCTNSVTEAAVFDSGPKAKIDEESQCDYEPSLCSNASAGADGPICVLSDSDDCTDIHTVRPTPNQHDLQAGHEVRLHVNEVPVPVDLPDLVPPQATGGETKQSEPHHMVPKVLPDNPADNPASHRACSVQGVSRVRVHSSPDTLLIPISPFPCCIIRLNVNDHRWVSEWKRGIRVDAWLDELSNRTYSLTFNYADPDDWKAKLTKVHDMSWFKWELGQDNPQLRLADSHSAQIPGEIPEEIFEKLAPIVASLPPKKSYKRADT